MGSILCSLVYAYIIVLVGRAILSWFPLSPGSPWAGIYSFIYSVTEPVLGPMRRVIPPMGGFDLSFLVLIFGLQLIVQPIVCSL